MAEELSEKAQAVGEALDTVRALQELIDERARTVVRKEVVDMINAGEAPDVWWEKYIASTETEERMRHLAREEIENAAPRQHAERAEQSFEFRNALAVMGGWVAEAEPHKIVEAVEVAIRERDDLKARVAELEAETERLRVLFNEEQEAVRAVVLEHDRTKAYARRLEATINKVWDLESEMFSRGGGNLPEPIPRTDLAPMRRAIYDATAEVERGPDLAWIAARKSEKLIAEEGL